MSAFLSALALGILLGGAIAGADELGTDTTDDGRDPFETYNRLVFSANDAIDQVVLRPLSFIYKEAVPPPIRLVAQNFLVWVSAPAAAVNNLLQGRFEASLSTLGWFVVNGLTLGAADMATEFGLERHRGDFGKTLHAWGVGGGPYLVWPLIGPANPRDAVGYVVDSFMDPVPYTGGSEFRDSYRIGRGAAQALDSRTRNFDNIDSLRRDSVDYYAAVRAIYHQRREPSSADDDDLFHEVDFDKELDRAASNPEVATTLADAHGN